MFRKLRLQLMLVNLSVIAVLFLLLISGTYYFVHSQMVEGGEHLMHRMSRDLVMGKSIDFPPFPPGPPNRDHAQDKDDLHGGPMIFYVKITPTGDVAQSSPFASLTPTQLSQLAQQTIAIAKNKGSVIFDQNEYNFRIIPAPNSPDVFILFQDFQRDRNLLKALVSGLGAAGIICMILSVFGSLFMAHRAMIPIQNSWQQQKNFLADASHEFRTPLAVIQTNLEIVRDNPDETVRSQEGWLNNIYEETLCMTKLVESLLFLARADSHQQLLTSNHFSLGGTITIAAELFRPVAALQGIILDLQIDTAISYTGDEAKLRQVVGILLDNAIRHTPTHGTITIHLESLAQGIVLSIVDTGEGIHPDHLEKIFERFYQSDCSRSQGGTGLGLSIAKWIVESHHGTISVLSTLGEGTTFKVFLPHTNAILQDSP